ncbi:(d)CMP kinase [Flavobacteriaceae bacterium TP-CH-4]|uniref:Cytidylate kinase n=1 Tax=Pelagihabitans pacificus TaxID=2696054 RepID=A0A967ATT0_9FLAO|nr:(d)CMP kinase [Pelagihabitans pacificus]NHF59797.1 (d)CMP kinase [Pelagihabitans pacificus]
MGKITIAIDGFSSTGKSTLAKQLAKKLEYIYVDTGAMYRAVTLFAMRNGIVENPGALVKLLPEIHLKFIYNKDAGYAEMYLNGENIEADIRTLEVSKFVSKIAEIGEVRQKLVEMQREMGREKGIVMDGRDIGTVVFPDAELKIFMTASPDARAARRYKELLDRGENVSYNEVLKNVRERDHIDSNRTFSPLKKANDAIAFDNTDMGLQEQFERMYNYALRVVKKFSEKT